MSKSPWFPIPTNTDFTLQNLPWGMFSVSGQQPRPGIAVGDHILDLLKVSELGLMSEIVVDPTVFSLPHLNKLISQGKHITNIIRHKIRDELLNEASTWKQHESIWVKQSEALMHMPIEIGDYTDFYSSKEHAINVGKMFRDPENALLPNWLHLPVGYHGRASSIVVSGTPIHRPQGQILPVGSESPILDATQKLDVELEMAFIIGKESTMGTSIPIEQAEEYIFGLVLFNDWSARDIQKWEYVPLGPFLGKNFASSISPWIVPMEALAPYRFKGSTQFPEVLPYLQYEGKHHYDIHLEFAITPDNKSETIVSRTNVKHLYWTMQQQLAHHTINGCNVRVGDMMASGTISGPDPGTYGSMLELSWNGTQPLTLKEGIQRSFIENGDTITMKGYAGSGEQKVGFGEIITQVLP